MPKTGWHKAKHCEQQLALNTPLYILHLEIQVDLTNTSVSDVDDEFYHLNQFKL